MSFTLPNPQKNDFASGQILSFAHLNNNANNVIAVANYIGSANTMIAVRNTALNLPTTNEAVAVDNLTLSQSIGTAGILQLQASSIRVLTAGVYLISAHATYSVPTGFLSNIMISIDAPVLGSYHADKTEFQNNLGGGRVSATTFVYLNANSDISLFVRNVAGGTGRSITYAILSVTRLK
jgi:hypothetical protein